MAASDEAEQRTDQRMHQDSATTGTDTARHLAEQVCRVYQYHDRDDTQAALEAQVTVDSYQFDHLGEDETRRASEHYIDALRAKDAVEGGYIADGAVISSGLDAADWWSVREHLERRAEVVGMSPEYAAKTVEGWRNHKTGRDYWTPIQEAQQHELRAALQDPEYPHKPKYGQAGYGPEAARYVVAIELHDMHTQDHWAEARQIMRPYFERILREHRQRDEG